jgi:hypothetical protein
MKGIREIINEPEEKKPIYKNRRQTSFNTEEFYNTRDLDLEDDEEYGSYPLKKPEKIQTIKGQLKIITTICFDEIGETADYFSEKYDEIKAEEKAKEIAYDQIEKLAGKGYNSKYTIRFDIDENEESFNVITILTPINHE